MKRFHVHVSVADLDHSIKFYSALFGAEPSVVKDDYAKWMIEDPRVNFAISSRGHVRHGVNHLGLQVDSDAELEALQAQVNAAEIVGVEQSGAACCYARSNKYWLTDPEGIAWETYNTLGEIPVFGENDAVDASAETAACCVPETPASTSCCGSNQAADSQAGKSSCCG